MPVLQQAARVPSRQASACLVFLGSLPALASWLSGTPGNLVKLWTFLFQERLREGQQRIAEGRLCWEPRLRRPGCLLPSWATPLVLTWESPCIWWHLGTARTQSRGLKARHRPLLKPTAGPLHPRKGIATFHLRPTLRQSIRTQFLKNSCPEGCPGPACLVPGLTYTEVASVWEAVASARAAGSGWGSCRLV